MSHRVDLWIASQSAAARAVARMRARSDVAAWTATAVLLLIHVERLARFAVDWPFHDDFTQILAVPGYLAHMPTFAERLAYVFSLSIEHRIATLRLAGWLGSLAPGGLDFRQLIAIGNGLLAIAATIFVLQFPRPQRAFAALVAALLLTSATHYGAQYWATGALQHFGVCAYAMLALSVLARGRSLLGAIAALAAAFTAANGLMVPIAAAVLLARIGRRREALVWATAGAALCAVYFVGYETPAGRLSITDVILDPPRLAVFALATLGGVAGGFVASIVLGAGVVLSWVALVLSGAWRRVPPVVIAAMLFVALTCATIAIGRAALGEEAATMSRYRVYSALAVLATLAATMPLLPLARGKVVLSVAAVAAAFVHVVGGAASMPWMVELSSLQRASKAHHAAVGRGFYVGFPPAEFGDFTLQRARDIGAYDGRRGAGNPIVATGGAPPVGDGPSVSSSHVHLVAGVLSVVGMLDGRHRATTLWLDDGRAAFRAELATVGCTGPEWHGRRTVFRGTVDIGGLPEGRFRVGYDSGAGSGVAWTERWVDVR